MKNRNVIQGTSYRKYLKITAIPSTGSPITSMDLDVTVDCNMRCVYCFKEKRHEHMDDIVAYDAITWLIHASGHAQSLNVALIGGEPLLRFDLIKKVVPFAKRRAAYHGKRIHFSATTNNTLVTDEIVDFWRQWGMGFHCSIDGIPDIQNSNRPLADGRSSSKMTEEGIAKILAYRPDTCARCTIIPSNTHCIVANYKYFRSLGFTNIAMVAGNPGEWNSHSLRKYKEQFLQVADLFMNDLRKGVKIRLKGITDTIECLAKGGRRSTTMCGAGRGMVLVDINGSLWPCHRWNKAANKTWRIGSIYEEFSEDSRKMLDIRNQAIFVSKDCTNCPASFLCSGGCPAENLESSGDVYSPIQNSCELILIMAEVGQSVHDKLLAERNDFFMRQYYRKNRLGILPAQAVPQNKH